LKTTGQLLFKIRSKKKEYEVYSNGEVRGFEDDAVTIFNGYIMQAKQWLACRQILDRLSHSLSKSVLNAAPTTGITSESLGAGHGTPPSSLISTSEMLTATGEKYIESGSGPASSVP
jgi:hypothetical protein